MRIGAEVKPGDILVGKITPKGETQLSPEEKLLRAIFGEKAGDVRDSSLRVPPGVGGIVINARVFSRKGTEKDERAKDIEDHERVRLEKMRDEEIKILRDSFFRQIKQQLVGTTTTGKLVDDKGKVLLQKGAALDEATLDDVPRKYWGELPVEGAEEIAQKLRELEEIVTLREEHFRDKIDRLSKGDELPPGVIKMVKVYIAIKRKLQVGDKMAGRHGNKGVISPHPAGRGHAVPAGRHAGRHRPQPARRSEPHERRADPRDAPRLGRARARLRSSSTCSRRSSAPSAMREHILQDLRRRRGASRSGSASSRDEDVRQLAQQAQPRRPLREPRVRRRAGGGDQELARARRACPTSGQAVLFDGRTGEAFDQEVTVGVMYMLKLHHLVDDKIHARSIGPYSLVTQQPLVTPRPSPKFSPVHRKPPRGP